MKTLSYVRSGQRNIEVVINLVIANGDMLTGKTNGANMEKTTSRSVVMDLGVQKDTNTISTSFGSNTAMGYGEPMSGKICTHHSQSTTNQSANFTKETEIR